MASPFNPFGGQSRGTAQAGTAGRGRGAPSGRGSQSAPRGSRGRATKWRGVERETGAHRGRGRGRGRGAGAAPTGATGPGASTAETSQPEVSNSPFAQISPRGPIANPFGGQAAQTSSPFSSIANGTASQKSLDTARGTLRQSFQRQPPVNTAASGLMQSVAVENASTSASYHERYEQLKVDRAKQRQKAIRDGQMADPNQPTSLNQAITPVGTCTSMCPDFERVERIVQKMVDKSEKYLHPSTNTLQNMETKMLKRFRRSAAGYDEQLPSDIRTPGALLQSTNYLIRHIVGGNEPLGIIHKFVWDRTRSIRNDFSVQQLTQEDDVKMAVICLERIARFHIVSLHLLSSPANEEPFDRHQEREQLNNTMLSLMYYYDDNRGRIRFPNEDEFRAYYIIFSIHDQRPDLEARVQTWPASLLNSPRVQVALELYAASCNTWDYQGTLDARRPNAIAQGFYTRFFNIINSPSVSYLMACVAEIYFNHVRQTAIRAIWKGYCRQPVSQQHKNEEWTVEDLMKVLHFDDDDQTIQFCEEQDLQLVTNANGQLYLTWGSRPVDSVAFQPSSEHAFSETYVETKRTGRTLVAVILGMTVREAARMGMIDQSCLPERTKQSPPEATAQQDDSLFVSDEDNQIPAPVVQIDSPSLDSEHQDSVSSVSGMRNIFQNPAPPLSVSPFPSAQPAQLAGQQPLNPFQTSQPSNPFASISSATSSLPAPTVTAPNPFSSIFSGGTAANTTTTSPTAAPNPFAIAASKTPSPFAPSPSPSASPFSFSKPPEAGQKVQTPPAAPNISQPTSLLSDGAFPSATHEVSAAKPNPFAASLSSFNPSKPTETTQEAGPQPSSSLFPTSKPFFPTPEVKVTKPAEDTSIAGPAAVPTSQPDFATSAPTPSTSSIFNLSPPTSTLQAEEKASSISTTTSATDQSSKFFDSAQPQAFKGFSQSSLFAPKAPTPEKASTQDPSFGPNTFFSGTSEAPQPSKPLFPTTTATVEPQSSKKDHFAPRNEITSTTPAGSPEMVPAESKGMSPEPEFQPVASQPSTAEPDRPAMQLEPSAAASQPPHLPSAPATDNWEDPDYATPEERKAAWLRVLARSRQRVLEREQAMSRKRALEEPVASEAVQEEPSPKAAKVSTPTETSPPGKYSLAQSYLKALPKLPCLERTKELLERKPQIDEPKPKPNQRQVDEDELLLNAARIAAEQLRTGPGIFDGIPAYSEPRRYVYSPRSSLGASTPYTQSASPPAHRYEVAYAPDNPVGLGRTMSRTEQRIRTTGARGLAYKPLKFPPKKDEKKNEKRDEKDRFTRSE